MIPPLAERNAYLWSGGRSPDGTTQTPDLFVLQMLTLWMMRVRWSFNSIRLAVVLLSFSFLFHNLAKGQGVPGQGVPGQGFPGRGVPGQGSGILGGVEPTGQYPNPQYYLALEIYRSGDLSTASAAFEGALRLGRKDIRGRWIDSIPTLAMLAECHWQLGNLVAAREAIDQAIGIAIANRGWLSRIDWVSVVQPNLQRSVRSTLWPQAQAVRRAPIANQVMFASGQVLTEQTIRQGGAIEELNFRNMDLVEIIRGLAIASHRRRVLMGPLCDQDPFIETLLESTKYPANLPAPIGRTLIGALRVTEYLAHHEDGTVVQESSEAALFGGATHPLSSLVLLSQMSSMIEEGRHQEVLAIALQAAHFAGAWEQFEWVGESLQLAAGCVDSSQAPLIVQAAEGIAQSIARVSPLCACHSLISGADAALVAGDLESANRLISKAKIFLARRDFFQPRLNAYASYVNAKYAAASGASQGLNQPSAFDIAINGVNDFAIRNRYRNRPLISTPYLYQMSRVLASLGTDLGRNSGEKWLNAYSKPPGLKVWRRDPVDAMSGVVADRTALFAARLNLAASGGYAESFLTSWNQALNSKFLQSLPLNGRFLQVRKLAVSDAQDLAAEVLDERNKMGPKMVRLMAEVKADAQADARSVDRLNQMESRVAQIAVDRVSIPSVAPPDLLEKEPTSKLPEQTAMVTFTVLGNELIGTYATSTKIQMWRAGSISKFTREIGLVLKAIGVGKIRGNRLPEDMSWREQAEQLREGLFENSEINFDQFQEIVFIPDGPLWYLPFELLPFPGHATDLLIDRVKIRYAPTPGFALKPDEDTAQNDQKFALAADLFFAPRDLEQNNALIDQLATLVPDTLRLPGSFQSASSFLGDSISDLVVAKPQFVNPKQPLAFYPAAYDQANPMGTLQAWLRFPLNAPERIVLAGLRTSVDGGSMGNGTELFHTLCALHCSGVGEAVLSRWAVGGESSAALLRELLGGLPGNSLSQAWGSARKQLRERDLDPTKEPLLTKAEHNLKELTGEEPLFWSGYLLSAPNRDPVANQP